MGKGILIGYFINPKEALAAYGALKRKGFWSIALVSKDPSGDVRVHRALPLRRSRIFSANPGSARSFGRNTTAVVSGPLFPGETALIVGASLEGLREPIKELSGFGDNPPVIFVFRSDRVGPFLRDQDVPVPSETPLAAAQLQEEARLLAERQEASLGRSAWKALLDRLETSRLRVQDACRSLGDASRLQQSLPLTAEWLLDNEYIFESNVRDVRTNLSRRYFRYLPVLGNGPYAGLPRIYGLAREIAGLSGFLTGEEGILGFLGAYQSVTPLSIGELWAFPQMLRIVLLEGIAGLSESALIELAEQETANFWANRLATANRRDSRQFYSIMAEMTERNRRPSLFFASQLVDYLYDEATALSAARGWLERVFESPLSELLIMEKKRLARDQLSIGNAFTSLRQLSALDWKDCFERLSLVEGILRSDPAGIYPCMDFETRDRYRHAVEELARGSDRSEPEIARMALEIASAEIQEDASERNRPHVGTYLIAEGRERLSRVAGCRETFRFRSRRWARAHHTPLYFFWLSAFSVSFLLLSVLPLIGLAPSSFLAIFSLLALIPSSQLSLELLNALIVRLMPPQILPKMDFRKTGIPDRYKALIVVPMMLSDKGTIRAEAEKLEIRYLANPERNLIYGLFADFRDSIDPSAENDDPLLESAKGRIEKLNALYGQGRFFLFHRKRRWSDTEKKHIGWERKRGKLEELNDLITGRRRQDAEDIVRVGDPSSLLDVRFVITLDSDNQLPPGSARRMIETMAHPLNEIRRNPSGRIVSGYGIVQPLVSASLPSTCATPFSRLFSDSEGVDPYTHAVSDAYQDLSGEGSYQGKGIYDVRAFASELSGRFPEATLLSHDLLEGAHMRTALASDIELFDEFPPDYYSYSLRQHRWIRGDWQIAPWISNRVPGAGPKKGKNPLGPMNRWKVLDNLRRSLVPLADMLILVIAWSLSETAGLVAGILVALESGMHPLSMLLAWLIDPKARKAFPFSKIPREFSRWLVKISLLPHQAALNANAILKTLYRRFISRRNLLEWTPAQAMKKKARNEVPLFILSLALASLFSAAAGLGIFLIRPDNLVPALPWLFLWFLCPLSGRLLCLKPRPKRGRRLLPSRDKVFLSRVARLTWRYFDDLVNEGNSWLPPDNFQVSHQNRVAPRTSPTNIGLYLSSILCAADFGYISGDEAVRRISLSMDSILKLERYEGHLLNWYDTRTRSPLEPRYVSSVDSGNLLGALWTLESGLRAILDEPVMDGRALTGIRDAALALRAALEEDKRDASVIRAADDAVRAWTALPPNLLGLVSEVAAAARKNPSAGSAGAAYWNDRIARQAADWMDVAERYLPWMHLIAEADLSGFPPPVASLLGTALVKAPSLRELASGTQAWIGPIAEMRNSPRRESAEWADRVFSAWERAKWLAGETLADIERTIRTCAEFSASINMAFLYNRERRLFSVGFNVSEGRLDRVYYDLLASESRLGSFVAIARGDAPPEHWFALGRPYGAIGRRRALLSWTGTMFEYLMPTLFQRSYGKSLLDKAIREAISIQIDYGRRNSVPWGISECAYGDLDAQKTYQYQAFGVPGLALKRGLPDKTVIAPYATLLALPFEPRQAFKNLTRLAKLGLLSDYGYYEALDFSREAGHGSPRGVVVRAYMAHHHGMSFLSLANFLHDNRLRGLFHSDPRVRMAEPLLHEHIPHRPPLHHISTRYRLASAAPVTDVTPSSSEFASPHGATPKTQILSNGRYGLMVSNSGSGYSRWNDIDVTRWRADATRDDSGCFCYFRDLDSGSLWCSGYQPVCGDAEQFGATFSLDRAHFMRTDSDIVTEMEIIVAPEDDVEIRRITLINRSPRSRRVALTSYVELAMAAHAADRQHPAFNKLFVQTEAIPEMETLLAYRRPRGPGDKAIFVAHRLCVEKTDGSPDDAPFAFETDRRRFIGRGHDLSDPMGTSGEPGGSRGFVLDPVLSIRREIALGIGKRFQVSIVIGAADSREKALGLMKRYGDPQVIARAMDLAWASAQVELRLLRIQNDDARRFQQLASHLLYANPLLRAPAKRIAENTKGQNGLWAYSISGDFPIALVSISEAQDLGLVRQMLQAHAFWRLHGLKADLVILNEESGGYDQPLKEELERLIRTNGAEAGFDCPGGIYLRAAKPIPEEDLTLLRAAASISLVAARGTLSQQLTSPYEEGQTLPEGLSRKRGPKDPSAALPFMDLHYFNSLGGFTEDGREYAIYLGPGMNTPAPWANVMANPGFGTIVSETGAGFTWQGNSQRNRLTRWSNDPVTDPGPECVYLRDEDSGVFWTPTAGPIREESAYRARHGAGYSVFEHNSHGIEQELTVFVPMDASGGLPVKVQGLRLRNDTERTRRLSVTYYVEWTLGEHRESARMHTVSTWDSEALALLAHNRFNPDAPERTAFASLSPPPSSWTADRSVFLGRNRSTKNPEALERAKLSRRVGAGLDPCAALQTLVALAPGETVSVYCMLGQAATKAEARNVVSALRDHRAAEKLLRSTREWWDGQLGAIQVHTPELAADLLLNRWLLYQSLSCRIWGRSGFYQSGGAYGFRDQLQDCAAFLYSDSAIAREHIILAASRQFKEGDVQHWWHPPVGAGIRTRISDDLLWLPFITAQYLRVTGDVSILDESVPFLEAPELGEGQGESLQTPVAAGERGSLFEHCRRAIDKSRRMGEHGLPLMGTGDWNDGMNLVGAGGKGESVWLSWFRAEALRGMSEMAALRGLAAESGSYGKEREELMGRTEAFAWDGEWYIRATFDDGTKLGSRESQEAVIDSLSQSWAVLCGSRDDEKARKALESAWNRLVLQDQSLVLLFEPPFEKSEPSPGYIKGYPPGVRENGGQYTHAAVWLAMAFARRGDGERAVKLLRMLNPIEHARDPESTWRYGVEPYVAVADIYRLPGLEGQGGWSWYTGSAAWMYRAWIEEILGLCVRGETMRIEPVIPSWWDGFRMNYRHGESLYEIHVDNPEHIERGIDWVELDGRKVDGGEILLERGLDKHRVVIRMGISEGKPLDQPIA